MMNRRGFFGAIAGMLAGAALDPERLLWVPGKKLISIPSAGNILLTRQMVTFEVLKVLESNLQVSREIHNKLRRIQGWATGPNLSVGDKFTIAGVYR